MEKIKNLVNILAGIFGFYILFGFLGVELTENFDTIAGLFLVVDIVWLTILVNKK